VTRPVRYDRQLVDDLAARVRWLRDHRPDDEIVRLEDALTTFVSRVARFPGIGREIERRGSISYRVRPVGDSLPYLVWYSYDMADPNGPVSLFMLLHEFQDRERVHPESFE
jgi:plasmid stabilization system protein ParE